LEQGANVNATTATGDTPLSFACENGHTDVADVLLSAGAELVRFGYSAGCGENFSNSFPLEQAVLDL